jgi:DNA-binding NtrC family response regulator
MGNRSKNALKIMIVEDDEDILRMYNDYLSSMGHRIIRTYVNADTILADIDVELPDIYIIDYRLLGNMNGIEVAIEILNKFPSSCIIFITAFELVKKEISRRDIFNGKNIEVLIKPVKLKQIQNSMMNLINKSNLVSTSAH